MPGSYSDPLSNANEAIHILKEAYYETPNSHTGTLILKAIDAISELKEEIKGYGQQNLSDLDSYEINESNSAL